MRHPRLPCGCCVPRDSMLFSVDLDPFIVSPCSGPYLITGIKELCIVSHRLERSPFSSLIFNPVFSSRIRMLSSSDRIEPEHQIEKCDLAVCAISEQGELRPREAPIVVDHLTGGHTVFVTFVALVEEEFRLFVRNNGRFDASADISIRGESLGKWLVAREPKAWHNIGCDSLFKFQDSYDRRSKVFEPSMIELRFQYLSQVEEERDKDGFVPVTVREPTPDDGPSCVPVSTALMQSQFETMEDEPFLTFVIAFYPPPTMFPTVPPPAYPEPVPGSISSSEGGSTTSSDSIFQVCIYYLPLFVPLFAHKLTDLCPLAAGP
ncbi:hypothetical protein EDB83DRAFT_732187 [Lactarius deliciosus]|nr:hypothetical protein EDB83DRAFT_732187 [Lactarius deliciosus]